MSLIFTKEEERMSFVVFLDIDGVLNTRTSCVRTPSAKYYGVEESRISLLSHAMRQNRADGVVLTTTWKNMRPDDEDFIYLVEALKKYDIEVLGRTKERWGSQREEGIKEYLKENPSVDEYVILDDNQYGFDDYNKMWERFLDTKGKGIENATYASRTPAIETILFLDAIKERS